MFLLCVAVVVACCCVLCCVVMLCVAYFWSSCLVLDHPALLVIVSTSRLFHLINNLHFCNIMYNSEQWRIRIAPNSPFRHITYLLSVRTGRTEHVHDSYFSNKKIKKQINIFIPTVSDLWLLFFFHFDIFSFIFIFISVNLNSITLNFRRRNGYFYAVQHFFSNPT